MSVLRKSRSAITALSANGMPFGVALEKGYFKDEGAQRHRAHLLRGRRHLAAQHAGRRRRALWRSQSGRAVSAILQGADLKIISDNVLTVAEFVWAVKPDSPIKTIKDFKGKKIGYTNPRSTSQALAIAAAAGGRATRPTTPSW